MVEDIHLRGHRRCVEVDSPKHQFHPLQHRDVISLLDPSHMHVTRVLVTSLLLVEVVAHGNHTGWERLALAFDSVPPLT